MQQISKFISNFAEQKEEVDSTWDQLGLDFIAADNELLTKFMPRRELSFHDQVKLLGYLSKNLSTLDGDIVEIGVWKGKSLALMERLMGQECQVIGIDPCELPGQKEELAYFRSKIFPNCTVVVNYSHLAMPNVLGLTKKIKLFHIDGGHQAINVWLDFLIYNPFVISGGYIVFDDYNDYKHSPEVRPTIDEMLALGLFANYEVIGATVEFPNSFLLKKL